MMDVPSGTVTVKPSISTVTRFTAPSAGRGTAGVPGSM